jgi:putative DNA-invertase from lambdoid prophage Rac
MSVGVYRCGLMTVPEKSVHKGSESPVDTCIYGHNLSGQSDREISMASILYCRVSTADQNISHQRTQAESAGFKIDTIISDVGVSGVQHRLADRPEGRRLFDLLRAGDELIVRWVDRLGRDYIDVTSAIREFMARGVIIKTVINRMVFDGATTDPIQQAVRDALIGFMAATAQSQAEATKAAQRAGIDAVIDDDTRYRGRKPTFNRMQFDIVLGMTGQGSGTTVISKLTGLKRQTVIRMRHDPVSAEATLAKWGM